jgi:hypothetical protein
MVGLLGAGVHARRGPVVDCRGLRFAIASGFPTHVDVDAVEAGAHRSTLVRLKE